MTTPRTIIILLTLSAFAVALAPLPSPNVVQAQGANLLTNPGFDGAMTPVGVGAVPSGWGLWGNADDSDKESLGALTRSAPYSWRLRRDYASFTAGGYQTVDVQPGATYQFGIFALIWTCDDAEFACRTENSTYSDTESGGRVRVGIDPAGGTSPFAGTVQWSGFRAPFNWGSFEYLSVNATATSNRMTVFTYFTSSQGMRFQDVFWDDAALTLVTPPGNNNPPPNDSPGDNVPPAATAVPVLADPVTRADGALVHIVQPGQSLWAISRAYDVPLNTLRELNDLINTDTIFSGQEIVVQAGRAAPTSTPIPPTPTRTVTTIALSPTPTTTATRPIAPTVIAAADQPPVTSDSILLAATAPDEDDDALSGGVVALAVGVVIVGLGVIGGILIIMWQVFNPTPPRRPGF